MNVLFAGASAVVTCAAFLSAWFIARRRAVSAADPARWPANLSVVPMVRYTNAYLARLGWEILPPMPAQGIMVRARKNGTMLALCVPHSNTSRLRTDITDATALYRLHGIPIGILSRKIMDHETRADADRSGLFVIHPTELHHAETMAARAVERLDEMARAADLRAAAPAIDVSLARDEAPVEMDREQIDLAKTDLADIGRTVPATEATGPALFSSGVVAAPFVLSTPIAGTVAAGLSELDGGIPAAPMPGQAPAADPEPAVVPPAEKLGIVQDIILPAATTDLPRCLLADNFDALPDPVMRQARERIYAARQVENNAVELIRYPPGTRLFGGHSYLLEHDGILAQDQLPPPHVLRDRGSIADLMRKPVERIEVSEPCVLVSRYGLMVWGHWVGELLPRILLTERAFPGRFKYVLTPDVFNSSAPRKVWNSIMDTIRLLGIGPDRIVPARENRHYIFANLHGVTSILTDGAFHPGAVAAMRAAYKVDPPRSGGRKIAILRTESTARNISNLADVIPPLRQRGYEFVEIGTVPFQEQLNLFSASTHVAGVLASGLTGLFFAPDGIRVQSLAPQGFGDRFFYRLMQLRQAKYVDLRGALTNRDPRSDVFSDFRIDPKDLERGLDLIEQD